MARKTKLTPRMRDMLTDKVTIAHVTGKDMYGQPTYEQYQLTKLRIDHESIKNTSSQGELLTHLDVYLVYPDYVKVVDSAGNSVSCPDLSKMDSDDEWKIIDDTVYRSVANVNIIKQPFRDMVFCYELEVV